MNTAAAPPLSIRRVYLAGLSLCIATWITPMAFAQTPAPAGELTLTDGRTVVSFARPDGFTEPSQSSPTHRVLQGQGSLTQLTVLPSDQPTDAGAAAAFLANTQQSMEQSKGKDLLDAPSAQSEPGFALVMHYRVRNTIETTTDTTLRWRRVGPLVVQSITDVTSTDPATLQSNNQAISQMLSYGTAPGFADAQTAAAAAPPDTGQNAIASTPTEPREKFASNTVEYTPPNGFELISTAKADTSRDYLSSSHKTEMILTVMPPGTPLDSSSGPIQLSNAKRDLAKYADQPTSPPELVANAALPVEIKWTFQRDGKPAIGYRLFRKIGKLQVVRCEITTTGDADKAHRLGEQTLNEMTSLLPDEPAPTASAKGSPSHTASGDVDSKINQRAQFALDLAKKLQLDKKDDDAYARFKYIVNQYPNSPAAAEAKTAVDTYEADPAFMERHKKPAEASASDKAVSALALADNYASAGNNDLARTKYQQIIRDYPGTPAAEKAKKRLAELDKSQAK